MFIFSSNSISCRNCREAFQWYGGVQYSFENWHENNPDSEDRCVIIHDGVWMDVDCIWPRGFVCKAPGNSCTIFCYQFIISVMV